MSVTVLDKNCFDVPERYKNFSSDEESTKSSAKSAEVRSTQ